MPRIPATDPLNSLSPAFAALARSFVRHLRARNLTPKTIATYRLAVRDLAAWAADQGLPGWDAIGRAQMEDHLIHLRDERGRKPAGVSVAYRALQQFFKWADEEGEISPNPMAKMKPPAVPEPHTRILSEREIKALREACAGTDFAARRDLAIIDLMLDTGIRLEECAGITVELLDVDMREVVVHGKGRRVRSVAFGRRTAVTLDRYLRVRAKHKHAASEALWLAERTGPVRGALTSGGIYQIITRRGRAAGIPDIHPHMTRHTWAHHAKLEGRLHDDEIQRLAGWRSPQMLARYGASAAHERALAAGKRTALGDRL